MKKMILLVSMLAGVMTFSGCVDDKESASVTAVREAKAAQLNALAALSNAQAAQVQAQADTENALREAKVAYEQARAAYQQAQADEAKARAQQAMAAAQNEIQRLANELEKMALNHKIAMIDLENEYQKKLAESNDGQKEYIAALFTAYKGAYNALFDQQQEIAQKKVTLARLQAGMVDGEEAKALQINGYNRQIVRAEQTIAENKAMLAVYEAQQAPEEAKAEYVAAQAELTSLEQAFSKTQKAYSASLTTESDMANLVLKQKYYKLAQAITASYNNEYDFSQFVKLNSYAVAPTGKDIPATVDTWWFKSVDKDGNETYTEVMKIYEPEELSKTIVLENGVEESWDYDYYELYYQLNAAGVKAYIDNLNAKVEAAEGKALADAKKALADQQKVIADKKQADKNDPTIADEEALLPGLETAVNNAESALEDANEAIAKIQALFDDMAAEAENWTNVIKQHNEALEAACDAYLANEKAEYAYNIQYKKVSALLQVVNGQYVDHNGNTVSLESKIFACEQQIKISLSAIDTAKKKIAELENMSIDEQIADLEQEIAMLEAEIPVLQQNVDKAKAALDAATAAQGE